MKLFYRFLVGLPLVFGMHKVIYCAVFVPDSVIVNNSQEGQVRPSPVNIETNHEREQEQSYNPYSAHNKNSVHPIQEPRILFRKKIWQEIYLQEPKNKPFFAKGQEITKFIVDGVKEGALVPYTDETFTQTMTKEQFLENISLPKEESGLSEAEKALGFKQDDSWGDRPSKKANEPIEDFFMPHELNIIEIMEEIIFDKINSTFIWDIQSFKLIIPANKFVTGLRKNVATFKYKDLVAYFDTKPKEAVWVNVKNNSANMRFAEAIELRFFDSRIIKMENPDDLALEDIYTKEPKSHLHAGNALEAELRDFVEQFPWEL